jgi:hypothetical protein
MRGRVQVSIRLDRAAEKRKIQEGACNVRGNRLMDWGELGVIRRFVQNRTLEGTVNLSNSG